MRILSGRKLTPRRYRDGDAGQKEGLGEARRWPRDAKVPEGIVEVVDGKVKIRKK